MAWQDSLANGLLKAAKYGAFFSYPLSWERLQIDDNQSYWASTTPNYRPNPHLTQDIHADLTIIGGGFTGVSTAYHFSQRYPDKRVVLLEAKSLANGASGRNGGMMLNWINGIEEDYGDMSQKVYAATNGGIDWIVDTIRRHKLDVAVRRDGSMVVYTAPDRAEAAHEEAEKLAAIGIPVRYLDSKELARTIGLKGAYGAVLDPNAGQLNGAQFIRALKPILLQQGVEIYESTPVLKIHEGATHSIVTPHGTVYSKALVLATNGYTGKLGYFRKAIFPLHSHVFATARLNNEQLAEIGWQRTAGYSDDYDRISYSSLTPQGNIIFGGGSNASYAYLFNNQTAYYGTPANALASFRAMEETMYAYLPKLRDIPILHRWTGTLAISLRRNCSIGVMGEHRNIYYGLGYSGHGVTLANLAGKIITDIYSADIAHWSTFPFYNDTFEPIPLEPFRSLGYHLTTRLTGKSPRAK